MQKLFPAQSYIVRLKLNLLFAEKTILIKFWVRCLHIFPSYLVPKIYLNLCRWKPLDYNQNQRHIQITWTDSCEVKRYEDLFIFGILASLASWPTQFVNNLTYLTYFVDIFLDIFLPDNLIFFKWTGAQNDSLTIMKISQYWCLLKDAQFMHQTRPKYCIFSTKTAMSITVI